MFNLKIIIVLLFSCHHYHYHLIPSIIFIVFFSKSNVLVKQWTFITGTWDRATKEATIYQDGAQVGQKNSSRNDLDLPNHVRSVFDVGYKRDSNTPMHGEMRDLAVFDRALTSQEIKLIEGKSILLKAYI